MKQIILTIGAVVTIGLAVSCTSENKQERMWDTSVNADTNMIDIDTSGVADTAGQDSMYRNSPARSDGRQSQNNP